MTDTVRQRAALSQQTSELLAHTILQILNGVAVPGEVTAVLRRACLEGRDRPPELLVIRIKELWAKIAEGSRVTFQERDRRYFAVIGECLVLYFGLHDAPPPVRHLSSPNVLRLRDRGSCGEPETFASQ